MMLTKVILRNTVFCLGLLVMNKVIAQPTVSASYPQILESHPYFNRQVPNISALSLNGSLVDLALYKDKIVFLHFWSLTCAGCYKELIELNILAQEYSNDDVVIISLMTESEPTLRKRILTHGTFYKLIKPVYGNDRINFQIIPNSDSIKSILSTKDLPVEGVPMSFIIKHGVLKNISYGYVMSLDNPPPAQSENYLHLKSMLDELLAR